MRGITDKFLRAGNFRQGHEGLDEILRRIGLTFPLPSQQLH